MNKQFYSLANKIHCVSFKRGEKQIEKNKKKCRESNKFNIKNKNPLQQRVFFGAANRI